MSAVGAGLMATSAAVFTGGVASAAFPHAYNGLIVFSSSRTTALHTGGSPNLYVVDPSGITTANDTSGTDQSHTRALTSSTAVDQGGFFSPNGATVVFFSDRTGSDQIWTVPTANVPVAQDTTGTSSPAADGATLAFSDPNNDDTWPSWSPDGHTIAFIQGGNQIVTLDTSAAGATPAVVSTGGSVQPNRPVFDPANPTTLLYVNGAHHIVEVSGIGGPSPTATDLSAASGIGTAADEYPDWSPDGTTIVFDSTRPVASSTSFHQIWTMAANGTAASPVFQSGGSPASTGMQDTQPVWSPDGTQLAWTRTLGNKDVEDEMVKPGAGDHAPSSSGVDLTVNPSNPTDNQPDWAGTDTPPAALPESPWAIALPISGLTLIGGAVVLRSRRRRSGATAG